MEILRIEDLSFRYAEAEQNAVEHVNLSLESGEFIVVCGESGCGKTTLLKLLKRELAPAGNVSGEIYYKGILQQELDEKMSACEIGYVLQNPDNQIVTDKVWHELAFGLENMGIPTEVIRRRVGEMAGYFGIESWFRKNTDELSGGQKQLLNLASVMVMQPEILILDEPTRFLLWKTAEFCFMPHREISALRLPKYVRTNRCSADCRALLGYSALSVFMMNARLP